MGGSFSGFCGLGGIFFLPRNMKMNRERYQELLEDHFLPFIASYRYTHFLQNGAPCQASNWIKNFFSNKSFFEVMDWPGNPPELNLIENVWNHMKNKLKA
jgi:hypothetical protein